MAPRPACDRYISREISWLEFNQRVLEEAADPSVPLLERLSFLSITASNLDEFFMVRVGGLRLLQRHGVRRRDLAGMTPAQQLTAIRERVNRMVRDQYQVCRELLDRQLPAHGLRRVMLDALTNEEKGYLRQRFERDLAPVISPMAIPRGTTFPLCRNLGLNLAVRLRNADRTGGSDLAVIPVGPAIPRLFEVPSASGYAYVLCEDILRFCAGHFFPQRRLLEVVPFRITRNADLSVQEDDAADLLTEMQAVLRARRQSHCVRLELGAGATATLKTQLRKALRIRAAEIYEIDGPLDLAALRPLIDVDGHEALHDEPHPPQPHPEIDLKTGIFDQIRERDVLLYHPYDSFDPVRKLIEEAAADDSVLAIKQILYRTSADSPIVAALLRAAQRGKIVTVIVELKARFDEARNIAWARHLEEEGIQVIYGVRNLKTHAKLCIVVRREPHGIVRYLHFGTGNYNERTARLYSDVSFMTANAQLGLDASAFFNAVTGYSEPQHLRKIEMAPLRLREHVLELIEAEIEMKASGLDAGITAKLNSLVDRQIIDALYRASAAGVPVRLNVRGICCLRPGVKGLSENIRVVSIVDRFLEHARILSFLHGGDPRVFISSADWMPRNLDRRIELLVPVEFRAGRDRLLAALEIHLADNVKGRELTPGGVYRRVTRKRGDPARRSQQILYENAKARADGARHAQRRIFEPHRPPADGQPKP